MPNIDDVIAAVKAVDAVSIDDEYFIQKKRIAYIQLHNALNGYMTGDFFDILHVRASLAHMIIGMTNLQETRLSMGKPKNICGYIDVGRREISIIKCWLCSKGKMQPDFKLAMDVNVLIEMTPKGDTRMFNIPPGVDVRDCGNIALDDVFMAMTFDQSPEMFAKLHRAIVYNRQYGPEDFNMRMCCVKDIIDENIADDMLPLLGDVLIHYGCCALMYSYRSGHALIIAGRELCAKRPADYRKAFADVFAESQNYMRTMRRTKAPTMTGTVVPGAPNMTGNIHHNVLPHYMYSYRVPYMRRY